MDTTTKYYGIFEEDLKGLVVFFSYCERENKMHDFYDHLKFLVNKYGLGRVDQAVKDINLPRT